MTGLSEISLLVMNKIDGTDKSIILGNTIYSANYICNQIEMFLSGTPVMSTHYLMLIQKMCEFLGTDRMKDYRVEHDSAVEVKRGLLYNRLSPQEIEAIQNKITANKITL